VETVNRGAEHMAARRIIGGGLPLSAEEAADPGFDLRKLALSAGA
jgi:3-phenylpropionate/trans-cinnamate dioxygenase ferredoxin reductase subunit